MHNWLSRAAASRPEQVALELTPGLDGRWSTRVTYAELYEATGAQAFAGEAPGASRSLDYADPLVFLRSLHGALREGAVAMPLDPRLSAEERAYRKDVDFRPPAGAATLLFTSGTTSKPKPVYLTGANWEANAIGSALALGLDRDERWLCTMPLSHVGGLSILLRSTFYATSVVLHQGFSTEAVLEELMNPERAITLVSLVPTMLTRLLDAGLSSPPTLRWALLGGASIPPALLERAAQAGVPVAPTYGMTETCSQFATFGRALYANEFCFEGDASQSQGEIVVRGRSVAPLTLDADGWFRTGDLGKLDGQGRLVITGRKSETIITGGENVSPSEVEEILAEHPAIAEAGVYAIPDDEWGEAVAAKVVLRAGESATDSDLTTFLKSRLASYKVPKRFTVTDTLPRTASGKLLRRDL